MNTLVAQQLPQIGDVPGKKIGASLIFINGVLYLFGYNWLESPIGKNQNDIYAYYLYNNTWTIILTNSSKPQPRIYHSAFSYNNCMYIFYGGILEISEQYDDIWKFNFTSYQWSLISSEISSFIVFASSIQINSKAYFLFGGNLIENFNSVFAVDLNENIFSRKYLSLNMASPSKRKHHGSYIVNDVIYIFGGINRLGEYLNDMWSFQISDNTWESVTPLGDIPSARADFGCGHGPGSLMFIFGGIGSNGIYNDGYYYDSSQNIWLQIDFKANKPSPRYSSCACVYQYYMIIIGGQDTLQGFNDVWLYTYLDNTFTEIVLAEMFQYDIKSHKCWLSETSKDNENNSEISIYVIGGSSFSGIPNQNLYKVTININTFSMKIDIVYVSSAIAVNYPSISVAGDYAFLFFGNYFNLVVKPSIFAINYNNIAIIPLEFNYSLGLYGHTVEYFKDSFYIFGGGFSIDSLITTGNTYNTVYKFSRNSNGPFFVCSDGAIPPDCEPCPVGTYFSNGICVKCSPGTASDKIASINSRQCFPCNYGYYSNKSGSAYCIQCTTNHYCPIRSSMPYKTLVKPVYQSNQPTTYQSSTAFVSTVINDSWYAFITLSSLLFILSVSTKDALLKRIIKFDLFINQHKQELDQCVQYTKTYIGALFSLSFIMGALITIFSSSLLYWYDNINEIKSLVPYITLQDNILANNLTIVTIFYLYGGKCLCNSNINVIESGFTYASSTFQCRLISGSCVLIKVYEKYSLKSNGALTFQLKESESFASLILVNISSSSSIPNENSNILVPIYPDSATEIFIGSTPTIISFTFIPSVSDMQVFTSQSSQWVNYATGYHISASGNASSKGLANTET